MTLYYLEGYSVKETAKLLDLTESAVKNRLARARARLRAELEDDVHTETVQGQSPETKGYMLRSCGGV